MRKKVSHILISLVAVIITVTTASFIFHRSIPKPVELRKGNKKLNLTVTNADSDIPDMPAPKSVFHLKTLINDRLHDICNILNQ